MTASTRDWIAYAILLLHAIVFVFFVLMLVTKLVEGMIRLVGGAHFDESTSPLDSGLFAAIMDLDCLNGVRGGKAAQRKRRKRGSRQLQRNVSAAGSLTTQMMLDRHSEGVQRQPVSQGTTPFLTPYAREEGASPQGGYFPGYQPPLGPPPLDRHSSDSNDPSASGHIMDAWRPSQPLAYAPPGGYVPSASSPPIEGMTGSAAGPSRSFSVVRGGRADYQNPYDVKGTAVPGRALSPPPVRIASPSKPSHNRQHSSSAIVERSDLSGPPSPSVAQTPALYPPGHDGPRANNQGLRPPMLAIPKRRSLNNLKDDHSPDSQYSSPTRARKGKAGKRKSKAGGWFGKGDETESSQAEESDDEPGPPRRKRQPQAFEPAPSPLREEKKGWKKALGLGRKKSVDDMAELAMDENKARKAALAAASGSMFAGVDAPPTPSRGFVVHRKGVTGGGRSNGSSPVQAPTGPNGEGSAQPRSFKVKRMGQPSSTSSSAAVNIPLAPPAGSSSSSRDNSSAIAAAASASRTSMDLARGIKGKNPRTSMPAAQPPPPPQSRNLPQSQSRQPQPQKQQQQQQQPQQPTKSFRVLGRPAASPTSSPVGGSSETGAAGSFVVNRPKSYQASPRADPSSATSTAYPVEQEPSYQAGYPPTSFVPVSDAGKRSSGGSFAPGRPDRDPRRSADYARQ